MSLELEGTRELTRQLLAMGAAVAGKELRGVARTAMKPVQQGFIARMRKGSQPHRTYRGRLVGGGFASRNTRIITVINKQTGSVEAVLGVRLEAFYIVQFSELGTSKMPPQPALVPAMEAAKSQTLSAIASDIRRRLDRIAAKGK